MVDDADFPLLCETCLGDNRYIRMTKIAPAEAKKCKVTGQSFQSYRWKAGTHGRMKETIVSKVVATARNICQACLNDLQFGLPVGVRDQLLANSTSTAMTMPDSQVGIQYYYQQQQQMQQEQQADYQHSQSYQVNSQNFQMAQQLQNFSQQYYDNNALKAQQQQQPQPLDQTTSLSTQQSQQQQPPPPPGSKPPVSQQPPSIASTPFRNLPKLCSFWTNGTCSRCVKKSCPFRPCSGHFVFPELAGQAQYQQLHAELQQLLQQHGAAYVQQHMTKEMKTNLHLALKNNNKNKEEAIRKRVAGTDELSQKYTQRFLASSGAVTSNATTTATITGLPTQFLPLPPPDDPSVVTLWFGSIDDTVTEADLRNALYAHGVNILHNNTSNSNSNNHGNIVHVTMARQQHCAFVQFCDRPTAMLAASQLFNNNNGNKFQVKGVNVPVNWAKPKTTTFATTTTTAPATTTFPLPYSYLPAAPTPTAPPTTATTTTVLSQKRKAEEEDGGVETSNGDGDNSNNNKSRNTSSDKATTIAA